MAAKINARAELLAGYKGKRGIEGTDQGRIALQAQLDQLRRDYQRVANENDRLRGDVDGQERLLNNIRDASNALKKEKRQLTATVVVAGVAFVVGGSILIAKKVVDAGVSLVVGGTSMVGMAVCTNQET